jgi:hypothetical protein
VSQPACLLALCGNSGCCKLSSVRALCAEAGIAVQELSDDLVDFDSRTISGGGGSGGYNYSGSRGSNNINASGYYGSSGWKHNPSAGSHGLQGDAYSNTAHDLFNIDGVTPGSWTLKVRYCWSDDVAFSFL